MRVTSFAWPKIKARLRGAEELVARARHHVHPRFEAVGHGGLALQAERREIHQRAAPQVLDQRHAALLGERRQLRELRLVDKALHAEVALVHAQDRTHVAVMPVERLLVVARVRAVRGPHLDQGGAAHLHDLGHAERAADLHQLAARNHDHLPRRERSERQEDRAGAVVHHRGRLGAGEPHEPALGPDAAVTALALFQVVLERRVARSDVGHHAARLLGERRATEVRVQHDAGGVQDPAQRRRAREPRALGGGAGQRLAVDRLPVLRALDRGTGLGERVAHRVGDHGARQVAAGLEQQLVAQQLLDRRQRTKRRPGHGVDASRARPSVRRRGAPPPHQAPGAARERGWHGPDRARPRA
jgi:hypothetical protein